MSSAPPIKPYRSVPVLIAQLRARNLILPQEDAVARQLLSRYGYYRLSGYYYPLRQMNPPGVPGRKDSFVAGASLELVIQLADFDKKMRLLAMEAIECVEVAVRASICEQLGKRDPFAHLNANQLNTEFTTRGFDQKSKLMISPHDEWMSRFRNAWDISKEEFVEHHKIRHGGDAPIWVAKEIWDFGMLSRLYEGLKRRDRDDIAALFAPIEGPVLVNWLRCFNFIRNASAHHSRLWNRTLPDTLKLPMPKACPDLLPLHEHARATRKLFGAFTCLRLLLRKIDPESSWLERLKVAAGTFPPSALISLRDSAGFIDGWADSPIWKSSNVSEQIAQTEPSTNST